MAWIILFLTFFSTHPVSADAAEPKDLGALSWQKKMKGLEQALQELLTDLASDARFNDPKNFKRIESNTGKLSKLSHSLKSGVDNSPDKDPSLSMIAARFSDEVDHATWALKNGRRDYAQNVLRSMTGYCIACHTRNGFGPSFSSLTSESSRLLSSLGGVEKAGYLASIRQFDRALEEYERYIAESKNAEHQPFEFNKAVRSALAITVRVKKDPDRALSLVEQVISAPKAPYFLKDQAVEWKKSIVSWKAELPGQPKTEEGYYAWAVRMIAEAKVLQKYPADRSADVLYLRASSAIHDLMGFAPDGAHATEALYLAGLCYEVLQGLNMWDMHESYYLACIRKSPNTEMAGRCYRRYEESVLLGFTGSGGTHLPQHVRDRLRQLEVLSFPNKSESKVNP